MATAGRPKRTLLHQVVDNVATLRKKEIASIESTLGPSPGSVDSLKVTMLKLIFSSFGPQMAMSTNSEAIFPLAM